MVAQEHHAFSSWLWRLSASAFFLLSLCPVVDSVRVAPLLLSSAADADAAAGNPNPSAPTSTKEVLFDAEVLAKEQELLAPRDAHIDTMNRAAEELNALQQMLKDARKRHAQVWGQSEQLWQRLLSLSGGRGANWSETLLREAVGERGGEFGAAVGEAERAKERLREQLLQEVAGRDVVREAKGRDAGGVGEAKDVLREALATEAAEREEILGEERFAAEESGGSVDVVEGIELVALDSTKDGSDYTRPPIKDCSLPVCFQGDDEDLASSLDRVNDSLASVNETLEEVMLRDRNYGTALHDFQTARKAVERPPNGSRTRSMVPFGGSRVALARPLSSLLGSCSLLTAQKRGRRAESRPTAPEHCVSQCLAQEKLLSEATCEVEELERRIDFAKAEYNGAIKALEIISEEIHAFRASAEARRKARFGSSAESKEDSATWALGG